MTSDYTRDHEHELEAEYLSAADAVVLDIYEADGALFVDVVVPCPTCSEPLRASARVREVVDADIEFPIDDAEDVYD
ncbi:hypothetical protein [Haloarcula sp. JP-L23]|uniref:hypothetical protein n=1 Tax=Haloarcula sp. JP-L23 TaxID=2716717 RepID=UPI00140F0C2A|nr:hypothetical protein G9465_22870 [Haloarcula sp. JP-L23]